MDLRAVLTQAAQAESDRRPAYRQLLQAALWVRRPADGLLAVTNPDSGRRAVPAFLSEDDAHAFWREATGGQMVEAEAISFMRLADGARAVGALVVDPAGANLVLSRSELLPLSAGEVPGEFAAWLRELGRLAREDREVVGRLRRTHMHVLAGKGAPGAEPRLYMLAKSEDGTMAVPCFSSAQTLAQFAQVRRLFEGSDEYTVAMLPGEHCLRIASGMGAYVLIDPESPWETQVEPTLL